MYDLEFTGERVVPGKVDPDLQLEHVSRYHFAARFVDGRAVLDFGCGTGYGSAILLEGGARQVLGTDRALEAILYARDRFAAPKLSFGVIDCEATGLASESFDTVVSFELIEHLGDVERYLREVARLLRPDGLFFVSTPNKRTYSDERRTPENPFHVHEFYLDELRAVLGEHFRSARVLGQSRTEGVFFQTDPRKQRAASPPLRTTFEGEEGLRDADYFIAVCTQTPARLDQLQQTTYFHVAESNAVRNRDRRIFDLQDELEGRTRWAKELESESQRRGKRILALQDELGERTTWAEQLAKDAEDRGRRVLELKAELEERLRWAKELERERDDRGRRIGELQNELELLGHLGHQITTLESELTARAESIERQLGERLAQLENDQASARAESRTVSEQLGQLTAGHERLFEGGDAFERTIEAQNQHLASMQATSEATRRLLDEARDAFERERQNEQGLTRWQRDSILLLREDLTRHERALQDLEDNVVKELSQANQRTDRRLVTGEQRLNDLEGRLGETADRLHTADQRLSHAEQVLVATAEARAQTDREVVRQLQSLHERLARQEQAIESTNDLLSRTLERTRDEIERSWVRTHDQADIMWNSLPWRAWSKLGRTIAKLPWSASRRALRRKQLEDASTQADLVRPAEKLVLRFRPESEPQVSVVVPFHDVGPFGDCLRSLAEAEQQVRFEVIAVTTGPKDVAQRALRSVDNLVLRHAHPSAGDLEALHRGLSVARAPHVLFLRPDVSLGEGAMAGLLATFDHFPDAAQVAPLVCDAENSVVRDAGTRVLRNGHCVPFQEGVAVDDPSLSFARPIDAVGDACVMVSKQAFARLGFWDTTLTQARLRWADFALRGASEGWATYLQPTIQAHRSTAPTTTPETDEAERATLLRRWRTLLASHGDADSQAAWWAGRRGRVLVLDHRLPTPDHDAGSVRMDALLQLLRGHGFHVTFLPENLYGMEPYYGQQRAAGIEVVTTPRYTSLRQYLDEHGSTFSLAIVSRLHIAQDHIDAVRETCPRARLVFDTVDLQFLRQRREAALANDEAGLAAAERTRSAELEVAAKADLTLVVSEAEQTILAQEAPGLQVQILSLIHDVAPIGTPYRDRRDFYFVGGFEHPPNLDAAMWLVKEIMPHVTRSLPGARLHLIGSKAPDSLAQLASEQVVVVGYVEDVAPYLARCRLSVAPLRYGAGIKGKVTQSLAHGLPCVMTSVAAEGIGLEHGHDAMIADEAAAFAQAIIEVYQRPRLWRRLARNGTGRIRERFSRQAAARALDELVNDLPAVTART